ncbi:Uma2 family endonuclease [Actinosynnema sp. NPDC023658]|uniref:Uma2 family endonuclease n=1 Tax=Actinosynnema sp. NPDC023658 TaxID=3155465 RepID=UPI0033F132D8
MSAALREEAALPNPMIGPHTLEEWLDLPPSEDGSRTELIFGHLLVTPPPSGEHQLTAYWLGRWIDDTIRAAGRSDLFFAPPVGVKISSTLRTALIPDAAILDRKPTGTSFPAEALLLAVEVWSPGNTRSERLAKLTAYAAAGVPFAWTIAQTSKASGLRLTAHRLKGGEYQAENVVDTGGPTTITAAPLPVTVDLDELGF